MPSAARRGPATCGEARHAQAQAINPKPTGSARSAIQVGTPSVMVLAGLRSTSHERDAAEREDRRDHRADGAGDDVRGVADRPLRQELAGREREQLAVAGGDRGPEHAEPERQVRRERGRSRNRRPKNLRETISASGSSMIPAERQAREAILGLDRERLIDTNGLTRCGLPATSGRRHAPARPAS